MADGFRGNDYTRYLSQCSRSTSSSSIGLLLIRRRTLRLFRRLVLSRRPRLFIYYTFLGFEEVDGEEEFWEEFACPFCSDYFDIVSLCCHIDEDHPMEAKNGVCPVCAVRVVAHITLQHANIFKLQRKRTSRRGGSHSMLSILKRELPDGNFQSVFGGSSCIVSSSSSSNVAADPLLSSFISPIANGFFTTESCISAETGSIKKTSMPSLSERDRNVKNPSLSAEDQKQKLKRSEFVGELVSSTILDNGL